jgi:hypothetical protein
MEPDASIDCARGNADALALGFTYAIGPSVPTGRMILVYDPLGGGRRLMCKELPTQRAAEDSKSGVMLLESLRRVQNSCF